MHTAGIIVEPAMDFIKFKAKDGKEITKPNEWYLVMIESTLRWQIPMVICRDHYEEAAKLIASVKGLRLFPLVQGRKYLPTCDELQQMVKSEGKQSYIQLLYTDDISFPYSVDGNTTEMEKTYPDSKIVSVLYSHQSVAESLVKYCEQANFWQSNLFSRYFKP
jgi:hypothetical protein